ncbi:hypothetical protein ABBQ38_012435 [Trebouxia sp. C0009 RCD-2024]
MSYQSRLFQSKWTYEPFDTAADDFNTKVGRVLSRGAYTGQLHKSSMYASSVSLQEPGIAATTPPSDGTPELNTSARASASSIGAAQGPSQYTWVDSAGKPIGCTLASPELAAQAKLAVKATTASMPKPYNKEVMDLWKRVNPGVMEGYVDMPGSTMTDHFKWLSAQQETLNRTHHFKKTDFSEYNEVAARSMKTLITNKSSP